MLEAPSFLSVNVSVNARICVVVPVYNCSAFVLTLLFQCLSLLCAM